MYFGLYSVYEVARPNLHWTLKPTQNTRSALACHVRAHVTGWAFRLDALMSKPLSDYPWFRFNIARFLQSTRGMSNAEIGEYINKIIDAWIDNRPDDLPSWVHDAASERLHKTAIYSGNRKSIDKQLMDNCEQLPISSPLLSGIKDLKKEDREVQGEEETAPAAPAAHEPPSWRTDYQIYLKEAEAAFDALESDLDWLEEMRHFHPGVYVRRTLQRMWTQYWGTEVGWKQKKSKKAKTINWKNTIQNTFHLSAVRIPRGEPDDEGKWIEVMRKCAVKSRMEVVQ